MDHLASGLRFERLMVRWQVGVVSFDIRLEMQSIQLWGIEQPWSPTYSQFGQSLFSIIFRLHIEDQAREHLTLMTFLPSAGADFGLLSRQTRLPLHAINPVDRQDLDQPADARRTIGGLR